MREGDPYLTDVLDSQRAEQRRILRQLPDWLIGSPHCGVVYLHEPEKLMDRPFVETLLRREIDVFCRAHADLLAEIGSATEQQRLARFILSEGSTEWTNLHDPMLVDAVRTLRQDAELRRTETPTPTIVDPSKLRDLAILIVLFGWVEQLVEDDYTDYRIERALAEVAPTGPTPD